MGLMLGFTLGSYHLLQIQHEESVNWHVLISKITTYRSQLLIETQGCKCLLNYFQNVATGIPSIPQGYHSKVRATPAKVKLAKGRFAHKVPFPGTSSTDLLNWTVGRNASV